MSGAVDLPVAMGLLEHVMLRAPLLYQWDSSLVDGCRRGLAKLCIRNVDAMRALRIESSRKKRRESLAFAVRGVAMSRRLSKPVEEFQEGRAFAYDAKTPHNSTM